MVSSSFILKDFSVMLYSYFFNMLKVGVPGFTQVPQLLVYNQDFVLTEYASEDIL